MSAAPLETTSLAPQTASVPAARWDWPFLALLAALWTWAIGIDAPFWQTNPDYSYGFIVPVLMVFYLWKRLGQTDPPAWRRIAPPSRAPGPPIQLLAEGLADTR